MLKNWSKKYKEYTMQLGGNVKLYVNAHSIKDNATIEYRCEWIQNVLELAKNNVAFERDDIRKYLGP